MGCISVPSRQSILSTLSAFTGALTKVMQPVNNVNTSEYALKVWTDGDEHEDDDATIFP